jgi:hypothetical protein
MASTVFPAPLTGPVSDKWVLISSVTPTAAASTVSFSISGYRKLMLRAVSLTLQTAGAGASVTFNGDTGANYAYAWFGGTTTQENQQKQNGSNITFNTGASSTSISGFTLTVDNADTTGIKTFTGFGTVIAPVIKDLSGVYIGSAPITTVTLTTPTTFAASGTVALYGVAA